MAHIRKITFERCDSSGITDQYMIEGTGETLAYVDWDGTSTIAAVTVFKPHNGYSRCYQNRSVVKVLGILERHLKEYEVR